jgi:cytochrome P450
LGKTLFSTNVQIDGLLRKDIGTIVEWIGNRRLRHPFVVPANWPTSGNKKFDKAVESLDGLIYKIIADKKKNPSQSSDLLSRLMENDENDIPKLSDNLLRDELVTIFLAGHETSANALNWAFYCLSEHLDIQEKVASEVAQLGDKDFKYEDLHQLTYTVQVLSEVMRMYPPVWHFGRVNLKEDELAGHKIPAGSSVRISPIIIHRNPKYWENPDKFDPERFAKGKKIAPNTYIPFGSGPRLCAGRNFAMMEMTLILAEVVRKFKFKSANKDIKMTPMVTLRTSEDVLLNLEPR